MTEQVRLDLCIVLGNGPSLRGFDFGRLDGYDALGMNAAYRYWDTIGWTPTHYCCLDDQLMKTHHAQIRRMVAIGKIRTFFLHASFFDLYPELVGRDDIVSYDQVSPHWYTKRGAKLGFRKLYDRPAFRVSDTSKVTTGAFAVRYCADLGYRRIALLGIDLRYVELLPEAKRIGDVALMINETPKANPNYFFDGYQIAGDLYNIPNPDVHQGDLHPRSFSLIARDFAKEGVDCEIVNCNPRSILVDRDTFPYRPIEEVLGVPNLGAVVVPTNGNEVDDILANFRLWSQWDYQPFCAEPADFKRPSLVFSFNNSAAKEYEERIEREFLKTGMTRYFRSVSFKYLDLSGESDLYVRDYSLKVGKQGFKAGPNNQFFDTLNSSTGLGTYIFLMETDCVPVRRGWLEQLIRVTDSAERPWVVGSIYRGVDSIDPAFQRHLNGNALYCVGDQDFIDFLNSFWRKEVADLVRDSDRRLAYDCALEVLFVRESRHRPDLVRVLRNTAHRFRFSGVVQNISAKADLSSASMEQVRAILASCPDTFIVHSRAIRKLVIDNTAMIDAVVANSRVNQHRQRFPRLLLLDMTAMGNGTATGEIKSTLLADWPAHRLLQVARHGNDGFALVSMGPQRTFPIRPVAGDEIKSAVDSFAPEVVLYRPVPDVPWLHELAMQTIDRLKVPVVSWIMDDWPARLEGDDPKQAAQLIPDLERIVRDSAELLSISSAMSDAFATRYGRSFTPLANGVDRKDWPAVREHVAGPLLVRYSGGLAVDMTRESVLRIARAVENLAGSGVPIRFEINTQKWSLDQSKDLFAKFKYTEAGSKTLSTDDYRAWLCEADVVVIAYNFDERSLRYIRFSLANKTPECLASGAVLLAHGPMGAATISYLADSDAAVVVAKEDDNAVIDALRLLQSDPARRSELAGRGRELAFSKHDVTRLRNELRKVIVSARDHKPFSPTSHELHQLRQSYADLQAHAAKLEALLVGGAGGSGAVTNGAPPDGADLLERLAHQLDGVAAVPESAARLLVTSAAGALILDPGATLGRLSQDAALANALERALAAVQGQPLAAHYDRVLARARA